jgi:hypothetical protein
VLATHHESLVSTIIGLVAWCAVDAAKVGVRMIGFMDMREWMNILEKAGELRRVRAEVDWDREIGAVARRVLGKKGPDRSYSSRAGSTGARTSSSELPAKSQCQSRA